VCVIVRAHTSDLGRAELAEIRELLDAAFAGDFADEDWEHALGGVHLLLSEGDRLVGHASVVQRRLVHRGIGIRAGYVEAVAVRQDRRGRGHGNALLAEVDDVVRRAYDLGALSAADRARRLYERRGWVRWAGETWVLGPDGPVRTPEDDDGVLVLRTPTSPELDLAGPLACDWRPGDVW
jgi:aminoglycoside 2'-N-acetyltransferase I